MKENNNIKALKSGVWYTAANFITKSIGFITTPIFTRLLTHADYGLFSNYISWQNTFLVFATLGLGTSFISARFDFSDDFDGYISSSLVLSTLVTLAWTIVIHLFPDSFSRFMGLDIKYINIMMAYFFTYSAVDMFLVRERYLYKYKISVAVSLLLVVSSAFLSVLLVLNMENKLLGRIAGDAAPTILIGIFLYGLLIRRGKHINTDYWKYALPICLPYIPHVLSLSVLNSVDKMMITKICGPEENALYSVAYSCGAVITVMVSSLNTAFSPWLGEKLNEKKYDEINRVSRYYILLFVCSAGGIMLIAPELLLFMGGRSYTGAKYVMPPVAFGCVCQFLYTLYVNVEQFNKKTVGMAIASMIAAISNYTLNYFFIPRFGYIAAAYTTLASFMILLFIHMLLVKQMGLKNIYPGKFIVVVLLAVSVYTLLVNVLYANNGIRYCVLAVYAVISVYVLLKQKSIFMLLFRKRNNGSL